MSDEPTIKIPKLKKIWAKLGTYKNDVLLQVVFLSILLYLSTVVEWVNTKYNKSIGWYDWSYLFTEFYAFEKLVLHMTAIKAIMYFGFPTLDKYLENSFDSTFESSQITNADKWKIVISFSVYFLLLWLSISLSNGIANGLK